MFVGATPAVMSNNTLTLEIYFSTLQYVDAGDLCLSTLQYVDAVTPEISACPLYSTSTR